MNWYTCILQSTDTQRYWCYSENPRLENELISILQSTSDTLMLYQNILWRHFNIYLIGILGLRNNLQTQRHIDAKIYHGFLVLRSLDLRINWYVFCNLLTHRHTNAKVSHGFIVIRNLGLRINWYVYFNLQTHRHTYTKIY